MSGSSLDGLDLALCDFENEHQFKLLASDSISYTKEWVSKLRESTNLSHAELCLLEVEYTTYMASIINMFLGDHSLEYISSHGHTLLHDPEHGFSYQLGQGAYLAGHLNAPIISEFRLQDIAKGGQGAPIAPVVEKYLLKGYDSYLNLGGICNCSIHHSDHIEAYDIGPCNQLLNALAMLLEKHYDENGALAKQGLVIDSLLRSSLEHIYYKQASPKSLDNQYVVKEFVKPFIDHSASVHDKLRTAVELICVIITNELEGKTTSVLVTGGGAFNVFLMSVLNEKLDAKNIKLEKPSDEIIEFKEAILMALMGYLRVNQKVNVFSSVTGATSDTIAGSIYR